MKKSLRLALLVCAGFGGLAFAGPALAKYDPSLTIEQSSYRLGAATTVDVFIAISEDADPTAKLTIFSPAGYGANLTAAPGTKIGSVLAIVRAKALGGARLPLAGDVLVANPNDATIKAAATRCTGSATHTTIWVLNTSLQGQTVAIPVFVDSVGGLVTQQVCLPSPDIPESAGGAKFGAQLILADFTVTGVFTNAGTQKQDGYEWAGVYTPYVPGTATVNAAGTLQWRTYIGLPSSLTLRKVKARRGFRLVGQLRIAGLSPRGVRLRLYAGRRPRPAPNATSAGTGKRVARLPRLPATGKYSVLRRPVRSTTYFQTRFESYLTDCSTTLPGVPPVKCAGEDLAAITSNQVKATKPKRRR
jgi:hypothetical protein